MTTKTRPSAAVRARKAKALSLHLGLNSVSAAAYNGWDGPLSACEFDATDMASIAKSKGERIRSALPRSQSPNLFVLGKAKAFLAQKPFTV